MLDVVTWVQRNADPTLAYRFACRVGMCGSCAMTVNGGPRWTCRTHVARPCSRTARLEIAPLRNMPVIKDLAADMKAFFEKWQRAEGVFHADQDAARRDRSARARTARARRRPMPAIECINCGVCYAACDTVAGTRIILGRPRSTGPGRWSTTRATRRARPRLAAVAQDGRLPRCHSHSQCADLLPERAEPDRFDRRAEARDGAVGLSAGEISRAGPAGSICCSGSRPGDGAAGVGSSPADLLCHAGRAFGGRDPGAHPRQRRLGGCLRPLRARGLGARGRSACA